MKCETVGYMIRHDAECITLVPTISEDGDGTDSMTIPTPWTTEIEELTDPRYEPETNEIGGYYEVE